MKRIVVFAGIFFLLLCCNKSKAQEQKNALPLDQPTKSNIVFLSPISALDIGFGVGASYERLFGRNDRYGIVLPGYFILENNGTESAPSADASNPLNKYFYFTPGLKFYPSGHKKVTYSFGPSLMFGFGSSRTNQYITNYNSISKQTVKYKRRRFGLLLNNYVTLDIGKYFALGLEGGIGICYLDKESFNGSEFYPDKDLKKGIDLAGQFSLSVGYRF